MFEFIKLFFFVCNYMQLSINFIEANSDNNFTKIL